ncbi:hypothetical protein DsansV1_C04g0038741 [Dioscorea sansibarensis]
MQKGVKSLALLLAKFQKSIWIKKGEQSFKQKLLMNLRTCHNLVLKMKRRIRGKAIKLVA